MHNFLHQHVLASCLMLLGLLFFAVAVAPAIVNAGGMGQLLNPINVQVVNRTGGTLTVGGLYALDVVQADGDSATPEAGAVNLVAVATANLRNPIVVAQQALADNESGTAVLRSPDVQILVEGTTDVTKGLNIIAINGQAYAKAQSVVATSPSIGFAWEDQTANSAVLTRCCFNGMAPVFTPAAVS